MKKKLFNILTCVALAAVLTVSICATRQTVDVENATYGVFGEGYLNSYTGSSYADTVANSNGNVFVSVYLYINSSQVAYKINTGSNYTTAWVTYAGSGTSAQGAHFIDRYESGVLVHYRGFSSVTL